MASDYKTDKWLGFSALLLSQPNNLHCITNTEDSTRRMTKVEIHNGAESKACDRIVKCTRLDTWKVSSVPKSYATDPVFPSLEYIARQESHQFWVDGGLKTQCHTCLVKLNWFSYQDCCKVRGYIYGRSIKFNSANVHRMFPELENFQTRTVWPINQKQVRIRCKLSMRKKH